MKNPYVGLPTKALLRLLQPLENIEWKKISHVFPISGSDGRCVQKASSNSSQNIFSEITRHSF